MGNIAHLSNIFTCFQYHFTNELLSPLVHVEGHGSYLKKKSEFRLPKDALCQVWLKLAPWYLRKIFLNIFNIILLFRYYLPLRKDVGLNL